MLRITRLAIAEKWDQSAHWITLALVAFSLITSSLGTSVRITSFLGTRLETTATAVEKALHYADLAALGIAGLHILVFLAFKRNIAREMAAAFARRFPKSGGNVATTDQPYFPDPIDPRDVQFVSATDGTLSTVVTMNREGYAGTSFEMTLEEIRKRNTNLLQKNPQIFMLVRNPLHETGQDNEFLGFTCILPLNAVGADCYLSGLIKDRNMRPSMLCGPAEPCTDLLLFAVALKKTYRKSKDLTAYLYPFMFRCAAHHIEIVTKAHFQEGVAQRVWIQSEHPNLETPLKDRGYSPSGTKSADGFELYCCPLNGDGS